MSSQSLSISDALNLAKQHQQAGRLDAATEICLQILRAAPDNLPLVTKVAPLLLRCGRYAEAETALRRVLPQASASVGVYNNLGAALHSQGKNAEAESMMRKALELEPGNVGLYRNLALFLLGQQKNAEAEPVLRAGLALQPDDPGLYANLAMSLLGQGKPTETGVVVSAALKLPPTDAASLSTLLYALTFDDTCSPERYLAEVRRAGAAMSAPAKPFTSWRVTPGVEATPLRVGLVSGDLRAHPVCVFLENLLTHIDRKRVQFIAYSTRHGGDAQTEKLKTLLSGWSDIHALRDEDAAKKIRDDGIHILIDLAGHTAYNRLPLFAWKPAPVQASWLGYFASTGIPAIDWLLVDEVSVPENERGLYTEQPWYLPDVRVCFTPPGRADALPPVPPPVLKNGYITFGSFQLLSKLGDPVLALWARVLAAIPTSRLRIQNGEMSLEPAREALLQRLEAFGVARERVSLVGRMPRNEYLAVHAEVDIALDTFPYPGHTTTCEALWMGVPTLTLAGRTLVSRNGASVMTVCGLPEWIATDADDYVRRAVMHASRPAELAELRKTLRDRFLASPVCDGAGFAENLTQALYGMWRAAG